jgi:hypothetical protein
MCSCGCALQHALDKLWLAASGKEGEGPAPNFGHTDAPLAQTLFMREPHFSC